MATPYVLKSSVDPSQLRVDYAKELNQEQLAVVQRGDGACLVLAGAGSGKTRTIVYRVAYLIEHGVAPDRILLVTFTNKAAKEMLARVEELLGAFPNSLWGGTFHHVANILLRKYGRHVGYEPNFTILDEEDSKDLVSVCIKSLKIDPKATRFPSAGVIRGLISLSRNTGEDLESLISESKPEFSKVLPSLIEVARLYEQRKRRANAMDFDDLLVVLRDLLKSHDEVRQRLATQFQYVLVDEYQDTNHLQAEIVNLLSSVHNNLLVVGDDAQSIYAFRGADIQNILTFPKVHPGAKLFTLATNYRSTQPILDVANAVIANNREQFPKKLTHVRDGSIKPVLVPAASDEQEASFIAQRILELRDEGVPMRDIAVLFRAAFHSQALEFELTRRDIPYEFRGGLRFFDRAHIKDVLAYLKVVENPHDEMSFLRILRHQVGIGEQTAGRMFEQVQAGLGPEEEGQHPLERLFLDIAPESRSERGWKALRGILEALIAERTQSPETLVRLVMDSEYRDYLKNQYQDSTDRLADLDQLALFAGKYESLSKFLSEVTLQESFGMAGAAEAGEREQIVLSTVHQAKGLEWRAVFLIHLSDTSFPHPRALEEDGGLEEERRLFYVAVTRAQEHLFLSYSLASGYRTMTMHLNAPSPFLKEIPEAMFEQYAISEALANDLELPEDPDQVINLDDDGNPKSLIDRVLQSHAEKKQRRKRPPYVH